MARRAEGRKPGVISLPQAFKKAYYGRYRAGRIYFKVVRSYLLFRYQIRFRGIAQSGSAPALGAGCREFESLYPDQITFISADFCADEKCKTGLKSAPVAHSDRASAF